VHGPVAVPADFGAQPSASEEVVSTALGGDWEFNEGEALVSASLTEREKNQLASLLRTIIRTVEGED